MLGSPRAERSRRDVLASDGAEGQDARMFSRKKDRVSVAIHLNARLRPLDRGERFEDPLDAHLRARIPGTSVVGGGTLVSAAGEPLSCDIEIAWAGSPEQAVSTLEPLLERLGTPRGSSVTVGAGSAVPLGRTEGLGIYLNGTDLPQEVYQQSDVNELIEQLLAALDDEGDLFSYWEGPTETALYLYGTSADAMRALVSPVLTTHALAERSRVSRLN